MMNVFRFVGDMSHLLSFFVLLLQLRVTKSASGTSAVGVGGCPPGDGCRLCEMSW